MDLDLSREMPMLSAAAVGAGCDAGPVPERSAECWLGLVAHLRGDLGDAGVAGSQPPRVLHPPVGQGLSHGHGQYCRGARPTSLVNRAAKADLDSPARAASRATVHGVPGCSRISLSAAPSCGPASALSQPPPPGGRSV